jgi:hypothetical protein
MKSLFTDTDPAAERVLIELARRAPAWKKFEQIARANETWRCFALAGLRSRFANEDEEELKLRLKALMLDRETMIRVYGWDPLIEGY